MYVSLRVKLSVGIIIICFLTGMFAILSVYRISANIIDKEYSDKADQITEAVVQTVDDVFKKADQAMYERKVAMKAERKE